MEIRERQIEDVLVSSPLLTRRILQLTEEPRLLGRQMTLPSGKLDLLYAYQTNLLLLELKVVPLKLEFIKQVSDYRNDLIGFQNAGKLLHGNIKTYLVCPTISPHLRTQALNQDIHCVDYSPEEVLQFFYTHFKPIAAFAEKKPIDIGIWNIHLIHDFIYLLEDTSSVKELQVLVEGSTKTLYNKIKFANELRLIQWTPNKDTIVLSNLGQQYVQAKDPIMPLRLSEKQTDLLKDFVMVNPYESPVILGIASVVESVFALAKNTYPVPVEHLIQYFTFHSGKHFDWQTPKARFSAAKMYSNYATDLGLLGKSGDSIFITPQGFRFTVQMQLHKSLRMTSSLNFS
jgi:hypothetical protein